MTSLLNPFLDTSPPEAAPDTVRSSQMPAPTEEPSGVHSVPSSPWGRRPDVALALAVVERESGVPVDEIRGRDRHKSVAMARHVVLWLLHSEGLSYPEIGRALYLDHTTAISAFRRIERERAKSAQCVAWTDSIRALYREQAKRS